MTELSTVYAPPHTTDPSTFDQEDQETFRLLNKLLKGGLPGHSRLPFFADQWDFLSKSAAEQDVRIWGSIILKTAAADLLLWRIRAQPRRIKRLNTFSTGKHDNVLGGLLLATNLDIVGVRSLCDNVLLNRNVSVHSKNISEVNMKVQDALELLARYPKLGISCPDETTILRNYHLLSGAPPSGKSPTVPAVTLPTGAGTLPSGKPHFPPAATLPSPSRKTPAPAATRASRKNSGKPGRK